MTDTERGHDGAGSQGDDEGVPGSLRQRYDAWRESIRRRPTADRAYRIGVGVLGGAIVVGGFALVPLPGPGWLIVFVGLAILATEFVWAERVEKFARQKVSAWTTWLGRQSIAVRLMFGVLTLAFVLAIFWLLFRLLGVPSWLPDGLISWVPGLTP